MLPVFPLTITLYLPATQAVQERDPASDTLPAGHAWHEASFMPPAFPVVLRYLPAPHEEQPLAILPVFPLATAAYLPETQEVQERDPESDTLPAAHALHAASFIPPTLASVVSRGLVPCSQRMERIEDSARVGKHIPDVSRYFPSPQATHVELNV